MEIPQHTISLHPEWLAMLFAHKSKTRAIFSDVLGLHDVHHIAIAYIAPNHHLFSISSSPSLEYNLLSSSLWQYDNAYNPTWFQRHETAHWQSLYAPERYDELYYLKQIKPHYPLGIAIATPHKTGHVIYTLASQHDNRHTHALFNKQRHELLQLGQYCLRQLTPLFFDDEVSASIVLPTSSAGLL